MGISRVYLSDWLQEHDMSEQYALSIFGSHIANKRWGIHLLGESTSSGGQGNMSDRQVFTLRLR